MIRTAPESVAARRWRAGVVVARLVAVGGMLSLAVAGGTGCAAATDKQVLAQASQAHGELEKAVVTDRQMSDYIQTVGSRIVDTAGRLHRTEYGKRYDEKSGGEDRSWMFSDAMRFHFVNSTTLNAFTTGGEHMYVYTELLRRSKNEAELAAVMAHEYAHVYGRHVQSGSSRQIYALLGMGGGAVAGYLAGGKDKGGEYAALGAGAGGAVAGLATAGFSREDEVEADKIGFDIYVRAGWHPDEFASFFRTLREVEQQSGGGQPEFLSTHPANARRVENAERWAAEYKQRHPDWETRVRRPVADDREFEQLKRRSVEIARSMPDDKSLDAQKLAAALPRSCLWPDEPQPASAKRAQQELLRDVEQRQPPSR